MRIHLRRLLQRSIPTRLQKYIWPLFDSLLLLILPARRSPSYGAIFMLHGVGDLLLAGHAIEGLATHMAKQGMPRRLFVQDGFGELARRYLPVDEVWEIDPERFRSNPVYRARVIGKVVWSGECLLAVHPSLNRRAAIEDSLVRACRAKEGWGCAGSPMFIGDAERVLGDRSYTSLVPYSDAEMHDLQRYREFMAAVGIEIEAAPWRLPPVPSSGTAWATPYLALCPEASDPRRTWPLARFVQAAASLARERGWTVVVLGNGKEPLLWPAPSVSVLDLRGRTALEDLPAILGGSELVLANDSGPFHLAVSLGKLSLGVGGSGMPTRYFPYPAKAAPGSRVVFRPVPCAGCRWICCHPHDDNQATMCVLEVSVDEVVRAASDLLDRLPFKVE